MSYSDFKTIADLAVLGIDSIESVKSIVDAKSVAPSEFLRSALQRFVPLAIAISTEKARSEFIIAPILSELVERNPKISLFSGTSFNVDPQLGLSGYCDFILTGSSDRLSIKSPVIIVVEAKNENINAGIAQCVATMVSAQIFNRPKQHPVYGLVTTGEAWRLLVLLPNGVVQMELLDRYLTPIEELLGLLIAISSS